MPPFNPLKLLSDPSANPQLTRSDASEADQQQADADVAFSVHDLGALALDDRGPVLSLDEARAQIAEHLKSRPTLGARPTIPLPPQLLFMRTSKAAADPIGGLAFAPLGA